MSGTLRSPAMIIFGSLLPERRREEPAELPRSVQSRGGIDMWVDDDFYEFS